MWRRARDSSGHRSWGDGKEPATETAEKESSQGKSSFWKQVKKLDPDRRRSYCREYYWPLVTEAPAVVK